MPGPPPLPANPRRRHFGCLGVFVTLLAVFALALIGLTVAMFTTALPYRLVASMIQKGSSTLKISEVGGNLSSGPRVGLITWGSGENRSEIRDFRIDYHGFSEAKRNHALVLNEIGASKVHLDFTGWSDHAQMSASASRSGDAPPFSQGSAGWPAGLDMIGVEKVSFEDVLLTNQRTGFRLAIPKFLWTGIKATPEKLDLGNLTVDSDLLTLRTGAGRTLPYRGKSLHFTTSFQGALQPGVDPVLRKPIAFEADLTPSADGSLLPVHLSAADGKLEWWETEKDAGALDATHLDLASYLSPAALLQIRAPDFPSDLSFHAEMAASSDGSNSLQLRSGSFILGSALFELQPADLGNPWHPAGKVRGLFHKDQQEISWELELGANAGEGIPRLEAKPPLPPAELLSLVFAGEPYAQLDASAKAAIDARVPAYFPTAPAPAP